MHMAVLVYMRSCRLGVITTTKVFLFLFLFFVCFFFFFMGKVPAMGMSVDDHRVADDDDSESVTNKSVT